ncbi:MAG TPA: DMT family transporter [Spirillospora sp.]|nr:DMT family transporter [Spirillospora sp.]
MPALLPYIALLVANVGLGAVPILVRLAQAEAMPSLSIAALRMTMAALILTPYMLARHRHEPRQLSRREGLWIGVAGFAAAMFYVLFFNSLEYTSVLIASVFSGTNPLWVAVMEIALLGAALRRSIWAGLALVLVGSTLFALSGSAGAVKTGDNPLLGGGLALLAALATATYYTIGRWVRQRVSALVYLWLIILTAVVVLLIIALLTGSPLTGYSVQGYGWVLLMTVGAQIIGQASIAYALAHLSSTFVSIALQLSIVIGAALALLIFQEHPQPLQMVASAVIVAGVLVVIVQPRH